MKYRVKTYSLRKFEIGEVIDNTKGKDKELFTGQTMGYRIHKRLIDRNPGWFEPVHDVKPGQYWSWYDQNDINAVTRIDDVQDGRVYWKCITEKNTFGCSRDALTSLATLLSKEKTEKALIAEAKWRGYKKADKWEPLWGSVQYWKPINIIREFRYKADEDVLFFGNVGIYQEGKWAEIIEDGWEVKNRWQAILGVQKGERRIEGFRGGELTKEEAEAIAEALNNIS